MAYSDFSENYQDRTAGLRRFNGNQPVSVVDKSPLGRFLDFASESFTPGFVQQNEEAAAQAKEVPFRDTLLGTIVSATIPFAGPIMDRNRGQAMAEYARSMPADAVSQVAGFMDLDPRNAEKYIPALLEAKQKSGIGGPFSGSVMEAQYQNILLNEKADTSSPVYRSAYIQMAQPRVSIDPNTGAQMIIRPDMSAYRKPTTARMPAQTGAQDPLQEFEAAQREQQAITGVSPAQNAAGARNLPPALSQFATQAGDEFGPAGGTEFIEPHKGPSKEERTKFNAAIAGGKTIINALDNYKKAYAGADVLEKARSVLGASTNLNTKYNSAALLAKGEELFALGVLSGPDLDIIQKTLGDPSKFSGAAAGDDVISSQVETVKDIIKDRINQRAISIGEEPPFAVKKLDPDERKALNEQLKQKYGK